jgi:prepilin-type N-terminal cleavage/methylation domain-containing protein
MRRSSGFTLLETLIALAIFSLIAVMATTGVSGALRAQSLNEAVVSSQSRLRRVTEVFTQELRSAVLGGVSNAPYASNDHQVSFVTLTGGAGDPVTPHDSGNNVSFSNAANFDLLWGDTAVDPATVLTGHHVLLVNDNGEAIVFKVTNVALQGTGTYNVVHAGCSNTIAYTNSRTMSMQSRAIGFRYDAASGTLYLTEGSDPEVPVAFDLSSVSIQYVYLTDTGGTVVRTTPLTSSTGQPVRSGTIGGQSVTLQRIGIAVSASDRANGRQVARTVSSQVEMASRHNFPIHQVTICN